mgnify:CR=1 FL=1|jgi:hypothetical protein
MMRLKMRVRKNMEVTGISVLGQVDGNLPADAA